MIYKFLVGMFLVLSCNLAIAQYTETQDDFSNEKVYSLKIPSIEGESAVMAISCYPKKELDIQLAITGTMFPNDTADGGMSISTTHKFDKSEDVITSDWFMNIMKFQNAWYRGDKVAFVKSAIISDQLNLKLNKRGDVFKFKLKGAAVHLKKILSGVVKHFVTTQLSRFLQFNHS